MQSVAKDGFKEVQSFEKVLSSWDATIEQHGAGPCERAAYFSHEIVGAIFSRLPEERGSGTE